LDQEILAIGLPKNSSVADSQISKKQIFMVEQIITFFFPHLCR